MKPILFNTQMVQAILDGRKTQTRRPIKGLFETHSNGNLTSADKEERLNSVKRQYQKGDVLWVRETWCKTMSIEPDYGIVTYHYRATSDVLTEQVPEDVIKWKPSIHMPREAARLFLKIKDVRIERISDISESDALAEGMKVFENGFVMPGTGYDQRGLCHTHASIAFSEAWDECYNFPYSWEGNPWVWVVEFEQVILE